MATKTEYLEKMFKDLKRSHYKLSKETKEIRSFIDDGYHATGEIIRRINDMAAVERSKPLQALMNHLTSEWNSERLEKVELASQIQFNVIDDMTKFEQLLEDQKKMTQQRHKDHVDVMKQQQRVNDLMIKDGGPLAREAQNELVSHRTRLGTTEESLNNNLAEFEYLRVRYVKDKFDRILRAHVAYHAKCVESMSSAILELNAIDPAQEALDLWNTLNQFDRAAGIVVKQQNPPNLARMQSAVGNGLIMNMQDSANQQSVPALTHVPGQAMGMGLNPQQQLALQHQQQQRLMQMQANQGQMLISPTGHAVGSLGHNQQQPIQSFQNTPQQATPIGMNQVGYMQGHPVAGQGVGMNGVNNPGMNARGTLMPTVHNNMQQQPTLMPMGSQYNSNAFASQRV